MCFLSLKFIYFLIFPRLKRLATLIQKKLCNLRCISGLTHSLKLAIELFLQNFSNRKPILKTLFYKTVVFLQNNKWNSPANEFVTAIGSGQFSLTGEEASFFISAIKNTKHFFSFLLSRKTTHGPLRCKRKNSNIGSRFSRRARKKN